MFCNIGKDKMEHYVGNVWR